eukprot:3032988-Amphidinium_carterae.1
MHQTTFLGGGQQECLKPLRAPHKWERPFPSRGWSRQCSTQNGDLPFLAAPKQPSAPSELTAANIVWD